MADVCASCGASGTLEYEPTLSALACTKCGTVSSASSSHAFEFLGRVNEEDDYQGGRTYLSGPFDEYGGIGGAGRGMGGKAAAWASKAGEYKKVYHSKKQDEAMTFIRRLLNRFGLYDSLQTRVKYLFSEAKRKIKFKWGKRAQLFAAACFYIAAKESKKNLWIVELADVLEIEDIYTLTRAIRVVKLELIPNNPNTDTEPAMFLERILAHLNTLFSSSSTSTPALHGSTVKSKKTWSASNLAWVRSISLPEVRTLASSLLSFGHSIALTAGRHPEQVAGAVILVALEGVARRPAPMQQEFADELAHLLAVKPFTIQERYREYNRLLANYAPQLPWLANEEFVVPGEKSAKGKGKKGIKSDLVRHTSDIVQFRRAIEAKMAKDKKVAEEEARMGKGKGKAVEQEEHEGGLFAGLEQLESAEEDEEVEDDQVAAQYFHDPLTSKNASDAFLRDPEPSSSSLLAESSSTTPSEPAKLLAGKLARATKPSHQAQDGPKRPGEYIRNGGRPQKKHKKVDDVAEGLLAGIASALTPSSRCSPRQLSLSASPEPPSLTASTAYSRRDVRMAHDPENNLMRQLLLAGNESVAIQAHLHQTATSSTRSISEPAKPATRLSRLLWEKKADDLDDDELFDDDELDTYVRSEAEIKAFWALPKTQLMLEQAKEMEAKAKTMPPRLPSKRKRHKLFSKYYPEYDEKTRKGGEVSAEPGDGAGGAGGAGGRGEREDTTESDSFAPRKRKTKLNPEAKARIDALLALESVGSDDEEGMPAPLGSDEFAGGAGGRRRGAAEWDMALEAAEEEGEDIDDNDSDLGAKSPAGTGAGDDGEEDWRAALGYGQHDDGGGEGWDD
ncbi:hypothetical protein JCM8547_007754 [Rhodosporidiobolus lusitaniae]